MKKRHVILIAASLVLVALGADLLYLGNLIQERIDAGLLQIPSRIYGRPLVIKPGDNIQTKFLFRNLESAGYREVSQVRTEGEYSIEGEEITIYPSGSKGKYEKSKGPVVITIDPVSGKVEEIRKGSSHILRAFLGYPKIGVLTDPKRQIRAYSPLHKISPHLIRAVIAAEDRRFFSHPGIDIRAIGRALVKDVASLSLKEGGSTITQQLARNFFLSFEKSLIRKFQEMLLAFMLEAKYSKEKILELYLNQVYLGQRGSEGIYGVEEAAKHYFGKNANSLDLPESILIAALIKSPNYYSPFRHPGRVAGRMRYVAEAMFEMGFITESQKKYALEHFPVLNLETERASRWDYITDALIEMLEDKIGEKDLLYGGYEIYTTLDPQILSIAGDSLSRGIVEVEKRYALPIPLQGAVVIIDNETGDALAIWGGRSYAESQFNRALKAKRQVGSLFKPFVVLAALRSSEPGRPVTLATKVNSSGVTWETENGLWAPKNFNDRDFGIVTVREILEHSVNTGAVFIAKEIGLEKIITLCTSLGIGERLKPYPSLILGSFAYSPLEMAYAYAVFPSMGVKHKRRLITTVKKDGEEIFSFPDFPVKIVKPEEAYLILYALEGAVTEGTARGIGSVFRENVAAKTGTTDDGRDSWTIAMTRDFTVCVWVGTDDASPTPLTGATGALPICRDILKRIYRTTPPPPFPVPEKVVFRKIDEETGLLATLGCGKYVKEAFIAGTEPLAFCTKHPATPLEETGRKILDFLQDLF